MFQEAQQKNNKISQTMTETFMPVSPRPRIEIIKEVYAELLSKPIPDPMECCFKLGIGFSEIAPITSEELFG